MNLSEAIKNLSNSCLKTAFFDFVIKGVACDSKKVQDGFIFVAIKGTVRDGNKFILQAIQNGAKAVISSRSFDHLINQLPHPVVLIHVSDARKALSLLAAEFYHWPSKKMKVVGITGTNGKTTITYLIEALVKKAGKNCGVIGTVNYRFADQVLASGNTTPGALELESILARMHEAKTDYVAMEVSSHALDQDRAHGINFSAAIFTNLTQDHLDYHPTLVDYFQAKCKLFRRLNKGSLAVINLDDSYARQLPHFTCGRLVSYAIDHPAMVSAQDIRYSQDKTEFILKIEDYRMAIKTNLVGRHNVYNLLAAAAWAWKEGFSLETIRATFEEFQQVPGRLEKINSGGRFSVFVDYAHTDDALKNVITSLRQVSPGRVIVVFGCGGDRDKAKRPLMGRVVTELADYAIITSDNPRSEEPLDIIDEIIKGIDKDNHIIIPDRKLAIRESLSVAGAGDTVLVAGKGHEDYQIVKGEVFEFDDRKVVRECLESMKS